jgi:hypothetical protein
MFPSTVSNESLSAIVLPFQTAFAIVQSFACNFNTLADARRDANVAATTFQPTQLATPPWQSVHSHAYFCPVPSWWYRPCSLVVVLDRS